ncbi:acetyltransferase [Clostridium hydrogeniformans]|uniref:acetyltransferase n=1 Tax=Clostridium hydrogeniformans TaxID=349933 RepID=UPI000484E9B1|nr:acetyltransferase [Clostridium hydrogeniformans]
MKKIVLIGAGGHCKVIIDLIKSKKEFEIIGILDKESNKDMNKVLDIPIIGTDSILQDLYNSGVEYAFICVGAINNMNIRNVIMSRLESIGFKFPVLIHRDAIVSSYSSIEDGTCIMSKAVINPDSTIGRNSIVNTGAIIEHDCRISSNCHVSPGCILGGNVELGVDTHIGIGSTVSNGVRIGNNVTIGAGSVVVKNIDMDNVIAFGNPAKIKRYK